MSFYDVLGVLPGATNSMLRKAYGKLALKHHPDKGGDVEIFKYIAMVFDVLSSPAKRKLYDETGKGSFTGPWQQPKPEAFPQFVKVESPPMNLHFMRQLMGFKGMHQRMWGRLSLAEALKRVAARTRRTHEIYKECQLAVEAGVSLRLYGTTEDEQGSWESMPVYGMCRLVRFAALAGQDVMELDFPASHPRQVLAYAMAHGLPHAVLSEAFGDVSKIKAFRSSFAPLPASSIKHICNAMCYGNGGKVWLKSHALSRLPARLAALRDEIKKVAKHIFDHAPEEWKLATAGRERQQLTMLSMMCQQHERIGLNKCVANLPDGVTLYGYLGDSILVKRFDCEAYCLSMAEQGILIDHKVMPSSLDEYAEAFLSITGIELDRRVLQVGICGLTSRWYMPICFCMRLYALCTLVCATTCLYISSLVYCFFY